MNLFRGMCTAAEWPIWVAAHLRVRGHHVARANLGSTPVLSRRTCVVVAEALGLEPPGASALDSVALCADVAVTGQSGGFTLRPVTNTEGEGFEPSVRLDDAQRFSRPPHSTALPPLHG